MSFFGVELNAQVNRLMMEIRLQLSKTKHIPNFRTIYRSFIGFDQQCTGLIQPHNFEKALNANGVFFKKYEVQAFEKAYRNQNGQINWFDFMKHLREPMGPSRRQLVENIFDSMDGQKAGKLIPEELMEHFNPKEIQAFKMGRKTCEIIQGELLSLFSIPQNCVTRDQFIAFYDDMNINFVHNDIFFRFVSSMWNYTAEKMEKAKEEDIKAVMKSLRFKLIEKTQATKDEYLVKKLFAQFDINDNGFLGAYELDILIKKCNLQVPAKLVAPILEKIDRNVSGYIEYDEFKKFLFHDPYPL